MIKHIDMSLVKIYWWIKALSKDGARCPKKWYEVSRTRYGTSRSDIKGFGTTTETFSNTISIPLAIASNLVPVVYPASLTIVIRVGYQTSPRAGWLPALTKSYRNMPFLPVASWNPGKKTTVIWMPKSENATCKLFVRYLQKETRLVIIQRCTFKLKDYAIA